MAGLYGERYDTTAQQHGRGEREVQQSDSRATYAGRNPKLCMGANDTCKGFRIKGKKLCAGHMRSSDPGMAT